MDEVKQYLPFEIVVKSKVHCKVTRYALHSQYCRDFVVFIYFHTHLRISLTHYCKMISLMAYC